MGNIMKQTYFGHAYGAGIELRDALISLVSSLPHSIVLARKNCLKLREDQSLIKGPSTVHSKHIKQVFIVI